MATTYKEPAQKRRPGAPKGSGVNVRERNRLIAQTKIKPLNVMLEVMAERYEAAKAAKSASARTKAQRDAVAVAAQVAPYLHPKLQATTLRGDPNAPVSFVLSLPSADQLRAAVRGSGGSVTENPRSSATTGGSFPDTGTSSSED